MRRWSTHVQPKTLQIRALACLLATCLAAACGSTPSAPTVASTPASVREVVVLGDSLAVTPSMGESFPAVLQTRVASAGLPWTVVNAGVSGDTTADGMSRSLPLLRNDVGVLVLELGANDGLQGLDVAAMERNLNTMVEAAQSRGVRVVLCGMETPPLRSVGYALAFHDVFPRVARRYNVPLVPFLLTGVALIPEMNGPDGIHPNAAGARRIADNVWPYLEPLLRASATSATDNR
jgi:acyl-CoA thioesterase-1